MHAALVRFARRHDDVLGGDMQRARAWLRGVNGDDGEDEDKEYMCGTESEEVRS